MSSITQWRKSQLGQLQDNRKYERSDYKHLRILKSATILKVILNPTYRLCTYTIIFLCILYIHYTKHPVHLSLLNITNHFSKHIATIITTVVPHYTILYYNIKLLICIYMNTLHVSESEVSNTLYLQYFHKRASESKRYRTKWRWRHLSNTQRI